MEFSWENSNVEEVNLHVSSQVENYKFEKFETKVLGKQLEEFYTVAKFKEVELTKKSKVHEIKINKFRRKVYDGTDKIRKVPVTIDGNKDTKYYTKEEVERFANECGYKINELEWLSREELIQLVYKLKSQIDVE